MSLLPPTLENMDVLTNEFFQKHWNAQEIQNPVPVWSGLQEVRYGEPLRYYDKQGVYAFVNKDGEVLYIGVGASRGSGLYKGHGIGARFHRYAKYVDGVYQIVDDRFRECRVRTIGFEVEQGYLAYALETFLIGRLNTQFNHYRPGSASN